MRLSYWLKRCFTAGMIGLILIVSGILAARMPRYTAGKILLPWSAFADGILPLLLISAAFLFRSRILAVCSLFSACWTLILRLTSLILFRLSGMHFTFSSVSLLLDHTDHHALRALLGKWYPLWLIPSILAGLALLAGLCVYAWKTLRKKRRPLHTAWGIAFGIAFLLSIAANAGFWILDRKGEDSTRFYHAYPVRPVSFTAPALIRDGWRAFQRTGSRGAGYFPEVMDPESAAYLRRIHEMPSADEPDAPAPEAVFDRIVIIALESLDYAFIGSQNPAMPQGITPHLDDLMRKHLSLKNYFTAAQPTSWGLNALLSSRLDYMRDLKYDKNVSLFQIARSLGYHTFYFSPTYGTFGDNRFTYRKLFQPDTIRFLEDWRLKYAFPVQAEWGLDDAQLYDGVCSELQKDFPEKSIVLISTMDTHFRYNPAGPGKDTADFGSRFLNSLHTTDRNLHDFLERFTANPDWYNERTLILITADHTATQGDNYLKRPVFEPDRIPLIFLTRNPSALKGISEEKRASVLDLTPTLVHWIGGKVPVTFMGRDLREEKQTAISRNMDDGLIIRTQDGRTLFVDLTKPRPEQLPQRAYYDLFRMFYDF